MSVHEYARREAQRDEMSAMSLTVRLVSHAAKRADPFNALCDLSGILFDCSSDTFDIGAHEMARELRDLAGYVLRAADCYRSEDAA